MVVPVVGGYGCVWFRGLIAILCLAPYVVYRHLNGRVDRDLVVGGLTAGVAFTTGLLLQGIGTALTSASNSAFITGLNVLFVHVYVAIRARKYTIYLLLSLALSVAGLCIMANPTSGASIGDLLVLAGSLAWAAQIVIVSKYSYADPLVFVFYEFVPSVALALPWYVEGGVLPDANALIYLLYLGVICSNVAFALQVIGQRYVLPSTAATVFLLEPPFASLFAYMILGETLSLNQLIGGSLIIAGLYLAIRGEEFLRKNQGIAMT